MTGTKTPDEYRLSIAQDLRTIVDLWSDLPDEYTHHAASKVMPGGNALALATPAASLTAWWFRYETAEHRAATREPHPDPWSDAHGGSNYGGDQTDSRHPYLVLAELEDGLRYIHGQPTELDGTVESASTYIRGKLDWMLATDDAGRPNFPGLKHWADEIENVRRALEDATKAGDRAQWTKVPCINPDCRDKPCLIRMYARRVEWDAYKCPGCGRRYDHTQFEQAKRQQLHDKGADRFVTVADAAATAPVPRDTLNSWIGRLNVISVCDLRTRRLLVWWPDVRERAETRKARLAKQQPNRERIAEEKRAERDRKASEAEAARRATEPTREEYEQRLIRRDAEAKS